MWRVIASSAVVILAPAPVPARVADVLGSRDLRPFATALGQAVARAIPVVAARGA
jgi:hypothetical protein